MATFHFNFSAPEGEAAAAAPALPAPAAALPPPSLPPQPLQLLPLPLPAALLPGCAFARVDATLQRYVVPDADAVSGVRGSDIVPHVFEGGTKLWECTLDLLRHARALEVAWAGARVLDLGCGGGLLGALALQRGAGAVVFQDLNAPVLLQVCARNIAANAPQQQLEGGRAGAGGGAPPPPPAWLLAGDWAAMLAALQPQVQPSAYSAAAALLQPGFDLILSAETLYRPAAYATLCPLTRTLLQRRGPAARALYATKRFYFGAELGGGTASFAAACAAAGLLATVVHSEQDGVSNVRDIILVTVAAP
jgi:predicted nicotinamide N-methyase